MQPKEMLRDSPTQQSHLNGVLHKLLPEYSSYNDDRIWNFTATLTVKQYKRLLTLYYQKQDTQIRKEFEDHIKSLVNQ